MFVVGETDADRLRSMAQQPVQMHAQGEVAGAAHAGRRNADQWEAGLRSEGFELAGTGSEAFQNEGARDARVEACCDGGFARCRRPACDERKAGRQGQPPFFDSLPGSTPSCLSLRYKWVRSSPVFSATRVMLPPSRVRWCSK